MSFFIEHLCEVLDKYGETETFDFIAKRVNRQMCEEPPILVNPILQKRVVLAPMYEHCLTKDLRFFPETHQQISKQKQPTLAETNILLKRIYLSWL